MQRSMAQEVLSFRALAALIAAWFRMPNRRRCAFAIATALALLAPTSSATADFIGQYSGTSYGEIELNPFYSTYSLAIAQPGYNPGINQRPTGTAIGDAGFSNFDSQGTDGATGVWCSSQSSGWAGMNPPGSSAESSDSNLSQFSLYYSKPGILAFDVRYSLQTSVQVDSQYEFGVDYADVKAYVNAAPVFKISSTASSFGTGISQTTGLNDTSGLMAFYVPAGWTTVEVVTYTNGDMRTVAPPPPVATPEPSSMVTMAIGSGGMLGMFFIRRRRQRRKALTIPGWTR